MMKLLRSVILGTIFVYSWLALATTPMIGQTQAETIAPVEKTFIVKPGKFVELNLTMKKNSEVEVNFNAAELVDWNIHSHVNDKTINHRNGTSKGSREKFKAEADGVYSYLWVNNGKKDLTISVILNLDKFSLVHSWHGESR